MFSSVDVSSVDVFQCTWFSICFIKSDISMVSNLMNYNNSSIYELKFRINIIYYEIKFGASMIKEARKIKMPNNCPI